MRSVNRTFYFFTFLLFSALYLPSRLSYSQVAANMSVETLNGSTDNTVATTTSEVTAAILVDELKSSGKKVFVYSTNEASGGAGKALRWATYTSNLSSLDATLSGVTGSGPEDIPGTCLLVNQANQNIYIAYSTNANTASGYDIKLKSVASGVADVVVNTGILGNQVVPRMAIDYARKELIIAWTDQSGLDGSGNGIYARRIDYTKIGTGTSVFVGNDILLNTTTTDHQVLTDLAVNPVTGELYMTAHYMNGPAGSGYDVYFKKFVRNTDGTFNLSSSEVLVNSGYTTDDQTNAKVSVNNTTGAYTIAWSSLSQDGAGYGAYAKIYSKTGSTLKSDFLINVSTANNQLNPKGFWDESTGSLLYLYHYSESSTVTVNYRTIDEDLNLSSTEGSVVPNTVGPYYRQFYSAAYNQTTKKVMVAYDVYNSYEGTGSYGKFRQLSFGAPSPGMPALDNSQNNTQSLSINEPITSPSQLNTLKTKDYAITREYMDGFGRTTQIVTYKGSPNKKDVIQPIMYDQYGRVTKTFLPYATSNASGSFRIISNWYGSTGSDGALANFYNATGDKVVNDSKPFTTSNYESSPLNRFMSQTPTGNDWQAKPITMSERPNTLADNVLKWAYNFTGGTATATVGGYYAAGTLTVTITGDEDGKQTMTFKTFKGEEVLKRMIGTIVTETYQVFDIDSKLRFIFPPEATKYINTNNTTPGAAIIVNYSDATFTDKYAYAYAYDKRGRQVEKKIPGRTQAGGTSAEYMVYDKLDRVVLTQDPKQRVANQWSFTKYDAMNRPVYAGLYNPGSLVTRTAMQTNVDGDAVVNEVRSSSGTHGYSSSAYPTSTSLSEVLTVNYYDDYNFNYDAGGTADYSYSNTGGPVGLETSAMSNTLGMSTGSKVKILGTTSDFLIKAIFCDKYGRPIQVKGNNALNLSSVADVTTNVYDFSGKTIASREVHAPAIDQSITIDKWFEYDHANRLNNIWQQNSVTLAGNTTTGVKVLFSQVKYNDLGQVVEKNLHSENQGATALQSVDYTYNIRGWKTHINNSSLDASSTNNNDDSNDLFGMELLYQNTTAGVTTTQQYNGSISAMLWKTNTPAAAPLKAYVYSYDGLDRLTNANYKEYTSGAWTNTNKFKESISGYDLNGNINSLQRYNASAAASDNLTYTYNANQHTKVEDSGTQQEYYGGFTNGSTATTEYTYDANGNMITDDNNKNVFTYNHLNLPTNISQTSSADVYNFVYDALGNKVKQYSTHFGNCAGGTTYYIDGFVYHSTECNPASPTNAVFTYLTTSEGRLTYNFSTNQFSYEYVLHDHLGNSRVMFDKDPTTGLARALQEDNYFPFGLKHGQSLVWSGSNTDANQYLYNNKEWFSHDFDDNGKGMHYYEYGARMYNPALARWIVIDPLAETYSNLSPYAYVDNDPVGMADIGGRGFWSKVKNAGKSISNTMIKVIKVAAPIVAGIVVGAVVTAAIVGTGGIAAVGLGTAIWAGAAGGAAGSAVTNIGSHFAQGKGIKDFSVKKLAKDVITGAIIGGITGGVAKGIQMLKQSKSIKDAAKAAEKAKNIRTEIGAEEAIHTMMEEGAENGGTKLISQFSGSSIEDATEYAMRTQNNIDHIFAAKHNLGDLVGKLGGQKNTISTVLKAGNGQFPTSGVFKFPVNIGGQSVWIKGKVIDGAVKLGTMWIP